VFVHGLIWNLVVSLLCDMGIPQEDSHRACAAHTIYLQWVAYPIDLTLLDRTGRFLRSYGGRGTHSSEQRCQWRETNHIRPGCCNKSRSHGSHWRVGILNVNIQCWKTRTAGRILYIRRAASHVGLDRTLQNRYSAAIGIMYDLILYWLSTDIFQTRVWSNLLHHGNIPGHYCLGIWFGNPQHRDRRCGAAHSQSRQF
jgi:hypothetical protein